MRWGWAALAGVAAVVAAVAVVLAVRQMHKRRLRRKRRPGEQRAGKPIFNAEVLVALVALAASVFFGVMALLQPNATSASAGQQSGSNTPSAGSGQPTPTNAVPGPNDAGSGTSPVVSAAVATPCPSAAQALVKELRYQVTAVKVDKYTVKVTVTAAGQPKAGMSYWFMLKVDYGSGSVEYYPRRTLTAQCSTFEVTISTKADLRYSRVGQVFALDGTQNADAEQRLIRQSTTMVDDYFTTATGEAVSNVVALPFG